MLNNSGTILTALLLSWICAGTATGQDISKIQDRKNSISVSILPAFDRTISVTYGRKFNNGKELTINPRLQAASSDVATEPATDEGKNRRFLQLVPDPQWFYDHYQLRIGIRFPIGKYFSYEPQLQVGYGKFFNKVLTIEDDIGSDAYDRYLRLDRQYYSAGVINTVNWIQEFGRLRIKYFTGVGAHIRQYHDTKYMEYRWYREISGYQPGSTTYYKARMTFHLGVELGYNF